MNTAAIVSGPALHQEPGLGALTIPGYLREITERYRDQEALVLHGIDAVQRWSYGELWHQARQVARALAACGVGKDSRVAVMMTNRPQWLAAAFGTWLAGGVVVAISTFSTPPELAYQLQLSQSSVLLFEAQILKKDFAADLAALEPAILTAQPGTLESVEFPFLRHLVCIDQVTASGATSGGTIEDWQAFLARGAAMNEKLIEATAASVLPTDAAILLFSSGSTGRPKGVLCAHRAVTIQMWRYPRLSGIEENIRSWTPNGFFWSATIVMTIGGTFSRGGTIVLQPTFDAVEAVKLIELERVTCPIARAHHWARMEETAQWKQADFSSLRYVHPASAAGRHASVSSSYSNTINSYGGTETFTFHTGSLPGAAPEDAAVGNGRPLPGNQVKIIDPNSGALLERGERGEIATKGPTLMLGYVGVPPEQYLDSHGFFRSGDGGYIDDQGRLFFEGRLTEIIKTGGAKVSLMEVDAALSAIAGVRFAKSVGVAHETLEEMLIACVVPEEGAALEENALRALLKQKLASYKVPRRILFMREDEIPMTGTGKVRLPELRKLVVDRL